MCKDSPRKLPFWRPRILTYFLPLIFATLGLFSSRVQASPDYVIRVIEAVSSQSAARLFHAHKASCGKSFAKTPPSVARMQSVSSYSFRDGKRNNRHRGLLYDEAELGLLDQAIDPIVNRVLNNLLQSGRFSHEDVLGMFKLDRSLNPARKKIITEEDVDAATLENPFDRDPRRGTHMRSADSLPQSRRFSALRIYDSSPVMKSFGRRYKPTKRGATDTIEIAERVFPGFDLDQMLAINGIKKSPFTWSLGLVNVVGPHKDAIRNLSAQAADLLDLHYNDRDFLNFGHTETIQKEDVDIVFYGDRWIRVYYKRLFGIEPMKSPLGGPLSFHKAGKEFFIYHMKGSAFLDAFFNLRFHQPSYGEDLSRRNEEELHRVLQTGVKKALASLDPRDFEVKTLDQLVTRSILLAQEYVYLAHNGLKSEDSFFSLVARLFLLRRGLPDDIFDPSNIEEAQKALAQFQFFSQSFHLGDLSQREISQMMLLQSVDFLIRDPMTFLLYSTAEMESYSGAN